MVAVSSTIMAQNVTTLKNEKEGSESEVRVEQMLVTRNQDKTLITMDFILDKLNVPSNRYRAFTPVIKSKDGQNVQRLKTLIVSGRRQNIVFERDGIDPLYADNCENVRRTKDAPQRYAYADAVTTQDWHRNADLFVECDYCGCGEMKNNQETFLASLLPPDPYDLINLTDIVPVAETKVRNLHGSAFITFVVNKWEMKPDYMDNRRELRKITDTLDVMVADPNVSIRQVKIHGWASPEGNYPHNKMLAENRAQSLTDYVQKQYNLPAEVFAKAEATPENWIGLKEVAEGLSEDILPHKTEILSTIGKVLADLDQGETSLADPDEHSIRAKYPEEYNYLLKNVYPSLRRSDYDISFNFSDFTLDQAKEIYKTKPYQLSLREMWNVANTMQPGSSDYNKVMQTAVNIYPDSPVANLNLANVAIRQKDPLKAETLLDKAGNSAEALNTRAVLAIIQGRYDDAEQLLAAAAAIGLDVSKNLEAIKLLR